MSNNPSVVHDESGIRVTYDLPELMRNLNGDAVESIVFVFTHEGVITDTTCDGEIVGTSAQEYDDIAFHTVG